MCIIKYYGGCKRNVLSNLCVVGIVYIGRVYNFLLLNVKGVVIVVVFFGGFRVFRFFEWSC